VPVNLVADYPDGAFEQKKAVSKIGRG
jgi:hypothetical protein